MIGQAVKHGRNSRDARNLCNHLLKDQGARIELINSAAGSLDEIMNDMLIFKDGSRVEQAFLHLSISPSRDMTDDELRHVVGIVSNHFNAADHQMAFVIHEKDRASGKGNRHAHLVLGKVGPDGHVIPAGFEKIRMETAMRIAEFEMKEPATLGRHHASSVKWLRANGREDIAHWLDLAHGEKPEKPKSPVSPAVRQKVERVTKTDLATVTMSIKSAWERSDSGQAFNAALAEHGFAIEKGQKAGVWLIVKDGNQIGSLDRILKEKRQIVNVRMEGFINDEKSNSREHKTGAGSAKRYTNSSRTSEANSWEGAGSSGTDFQSNGDTKANRGRSNSSDPRLPLPAHFRSETPVSDASGHRLEVRRFDEIQSIKTLEIPVTGWGRLRDLRDDLLKAIKDAANKIRAYRNSQKVFDVGNFRNNEIIDTFEKATRYSAENMLKLEKLDPALSAFREFYSDKLHGISKDVISNNIDSWRKIGSDIISRDINGNDDFNSVMRLG